MTQAPGVTPKPFRFIGGDPSLDFVNTVDWSDTGRQHERMPDYAFLVKWAEEAGLLRRAEARALQVAAEAHPAEAARAYAAAVALRDQIQAAWTAIIGRGTPTPEQLAALERAFSEASRHRRLRPRPGGRPAGLEWQWESAAEQLRRPLWPVALAAVELLVSEEAERVKACPGPVCGWMYVDRSRNGLRRWCDMDTCGAREKARRHYARVRASARRAKGS